MRIVNVVGARPNLMKIAPIMAEMRRFPDIEALLVHTGQHYDDRMSGVFFRELGIPEPDYNLEVGSATHTAQTAAIMLALEPLLVSLRPDLLVVVGDVNSTLAASLVAAKMDIPIAHVEAGLRSFDRRMPEEINRIVTDSLADFLLTSEPSGAQNLRREGVAEERIFFVGNVMIDTLLRQRSRAEALGVPARFDLAPDQYALLTLHRPSNVDDARVLGGILQAVATIQNSLPVLFPIHPRTRLRLAELGHTVRVEELPNLRLVEPLGYLEFLSLMAHARFVLTDSGGVQEETTILGIPCLTLRENTERPATVTHGTNEVVGVAPAAITTAAGRILAGQWKTPRRPDLWDGHAAARIVDVLRGQIGGQHGTS